MKIVIAILAAIVAIWVLVQVVKLAFGMVAILIGLGIAVAVYFVAEKLIGKSR